MDIEYAIQNDDSGLITRLASKHPTDNMLIQLILAGARYTMLVPRDVLLPFLERLAGDMKPLRDALRNATRNATRMSSSEGEEGRVEGEEEGGKEASSEVEVDLSGVLYCAYVNRDNPYLKSVYMNEYMQINSGR
jgi:hypothetical protein